eukprot:1180339-Prorocentrum_minimum.AAC.2
MAIVLLREAVVGAAVPPSSHSLEGLLWAPCGNGQPWKSNGAGRVGNDNTRRGVVRARSAASSEARVSLGGPIRESLWESGGTHPTPEEGVVGTTQVVTTHPPNPVREKAPREEAAAGAEQRLGGAARKMHQRSERFRQRTNNATTETRTPSGKIIFKAEIAFGPSDWVASRAGGQL